MIKYLVLLLFFSSLSANVQTPEDIQRRAFFEQFSRVNASDRSVPKTLHFIWLGLAPFPETSLANVRKWQALHPDWRICFWTDVEEAPISGLEVRKVEELSFTRLEHAFSKADNFGERAKILSYEILFQEGGVYIDHDCAPCKPLDLQASFYCGLEPEGSSVLSTSVYPSTHLIGAHPRHEILDEAMQWLEAHWDELEEKNPGTAPLAIFSRAAHRTHWALSVGIQRAAGRDALILSSEAFSQPQASAKSYAIHSHAATWYKPVALDGELQKLSSLLEKQRENSVLVCSLGLMGLVGTVFAFFALRKKAIVLLLLIAGTLQADPFEVLMGSETPHWNHLTSERDLQLLKNCKALFLQEHPTQKERLIPSVIHFIWLGPRPFPPESVENVRSWIALHPGWKVKFWTDRLRDAPCIGMELIDVKDYPFQFLRSRYEESQNWGEKSDVLRFEILYREGGVYVDHDAKCLKDFEPFHHTYDFYAGLETPHPLVMGRCLTAGSGLIAARPQHPLILRVLQLMDERWERLNKKYRGNDHYSNMQRVMERTYMPLTEAIEEGVPSPGVVFPCAYFFPKGGIHPLYSQHFFANSWATDAATQPKMDKNHRRIFAQLKKRTEMLYRIAWGLLSANVLALAGLFFYSRRRIL